MGNEESLTLYDMFEQVTRPCCGMPARVDDPSVNSASNLESSAAAHKHSVPRRKASSSAVGLSSLLPREVAVANESIGRLLSAKLFERAITRAPS